jgi:hypothetical protein
MLFGLKIIFYNKKANKINKVDSIFMLCSATQISILALVENSDHIALSKNY